MAGREGRFVPGRRSSLSRQNASCSTPRGECGSNKRGRFPSRHLQDAAAAQGGSRDRNATRSLAALPPSAACVSQLLTRPSTVAPAFGRGIMTGCLASGGVRNEPRNIFRLPRSGRDTKRKVAFMQGTTSMHLPDLSALRDLAVLISAIAGLVTAIATLIRARRGR